MSNIRVPTGDAAEASGFVTHRGGDRTCFEALEDKRVVEPGGEQERAHHISDLASTADGRPPAERDLLDDLVRQTPARGGA